MFRPKPLIKRVENGSVETKTQTENGIESRRMIVRRREITWGIVVKIDPATGKFMPPYHYLKPTNEAIYDQIVTEMDAYIHRATYDDNLRLNAATG